MKKLVRKVALVAAVAAATLGFATATAPTAQADTAWDCGGGCIVDPGN